MLSTFRFYLGHASVVIFKDVGSMENSCNQMELNSGDNFKII